MNLSGMFCNIILLKIFWICHESIRNVFQYDFAHFFFNLSQIYLERFAIKCCPKCLDLEYFALCISEFVTDLSGMFCNAMLPKICWVPNPSEMLFNKILHKIFWICHESIRNVFQYDFSQLFFNLSRSY